jgi:hypothetical protein
VIAYRAMLDVPRELVVKIAGLLRSEQRRRGTQWPCFKLSVGRCRVGGSGSVVGG